MPDSTCTTISCAVLVMFIAHISSYLCIRLHKQLNSMISCSDSWVPEFKKAADSVSTNAGSKSAVTNAFSSISKLSSSAQAGDSTGAKQAFVGVVSSLQTWASGSGLQVKGL